MQDVWNVLGKTVFKLMFRKWEKCEMLRTPTKGDEVCLKVDMLLGHGNQTLLILSLQVGFLTEGMKMVPLP